jgi:hypothetical protein
VPAASRAAPRGEIRGVDGHWDARLALAFARVGERSVMTHREHRGPLVVQKALHPEGPGVCQCVIVHPPAGIAGGDRLWLDVALGRDSFVQLTTPGAAKWYRSAGRSASQSLADQYLVMERGESVAHGAGADMERDGVRSLLAI